MLAKDLAVVLSVTGLVFASAMPLVRPGRVAAEGPDDAPAVARPALEVDGAALSLVTARDVYEVGDKPDLTIEARNLAGKRLQVAPRVTLLAHSPESMFSRVPSIPTEVGTYEAQVTLAPDETLRVAVPLDLALAPGYSYVVRVEAGGQTLDLGHFSVPPAGNGPGGRAAQLRLVSGG